MRIVLDTNVLVAALLSPYGPPAQVLNLLLSERLTLCYDARIVAEYRSVLERAKFGFDTVHVQELLTFLQDTGELIASEPLDAALPDAADLMFLEVAAAAAAEHLVTGNVRHFPARQRCGVSVIRPAKLIALIVGGD